MKKVYLLNLTASLCLFIGVILNLLHRFVSLPSVLYMLTIPLCIAAIILYGISWKLIKKSK